ncbi:MAG: type II CAAX prenyl endopeptidase Rce1 family protein, partial [Candidatus Hodarchaeota archaeon]
VTGRSILIPAMWALGALVPMLRGGPPSSLLGLSRSHLALGLKYYLWSTIVVFPLFGGGFFLYRQLGLPHPGSSVPFGTSLTEWILYQFVFVGVFEELFFRGYLHCQAEKIASAVFSGRMWVLWLPIVSSAFLFGIAHVAVKFELAGFVVFFPGLLFAWLRARTGSLVAPILSHGSANVFFMLLLESVS